MNRSNAPKSLAGNPRLSRWVRVHRDGTVSIYSGKVEFGQGIRTALAQIAAEELDVAITRIRMEPVDTICSPNEGITSGSLSIQDSGAALRHACAEVRALLLTRAAEQLGVPVEGLSVDDGSIHGAGCRTTYWACVDRALLERDFTGTVPPKSPREYRVVGQPVARLDIPDKMLGRARFIQDLDLPAMLFGRVVRPPRGFSRLAKLGTEALDALPNVTVVRDGSFVGVFAEREEVAVAARKALLEHSVWETVPALPQDIHAYLREHVTEDRVVLERQDREALTGTHQSFDAAYTKPFISHASIGPACALAQWQGDTLTVWTQSQGIFNLRRDLAMALRIPEALITVRHVEGAGCYGQNGADDVALDAALIARGAGARPVQVQWMREDEFAWAPCGPAMAMKLHAEVNSAGRIVLWRHELWSSGHSHRPSRSATPTLIASWHLADPFARPAAINNPAPAGGAESNAVPLYDFPDVRAVNHYIRDMPVRTSALRSLGAYANVFAIESFLDEIARSLECDPLEFRLRHLSDARARNVIYAAVEQSGWHGWVASEGRGHGLAFAQFKNMDAYCAVVAEVAVERAVRVTRLVVAIDVGLVINPDGVRNQVEGGAIQSTSWTLQEALQLEEQGISGLGWDDYPILKFGAVPAVEIVILDRPEDPPVGAGEAVQGPTAAAIANAVHDALGVRVRDLPLTPERIREAIDRE